MIEADKEYLFTIGQNIAKARRRKKLTQVDVCVELKMDKPYLSSIENGRQNPTLLTLKKLADAIGVEVEEFLKD
ncbi:helix-turn-helix transcriptional regulator [Lacinutrix sp. MedPE-SW]|uniref:helix-turn-helix domain-containing protein n=1 Tax=Lacinutrix sp. MedPE-SW TaxID=1860087 RepID=UPI00091AC79B|nr:helix-turn-helix transcriptional regulator [Lacinutrix sp. MedPE-SW]OIQ21198.1 MAG: DNA-binding protein [Lacinutrix sp. MedPE-SW]